MIEKPYTSIVIPVYNAEKYLGECIDSVLSQSFRDFELILVNDGSKDSSGEICDEYAKKDERIRVIHQLNGGVTSARKAGVEASSAEWIMFVDADDKVTTDGLQRLVEEQQKDPELDIIEGSYQWFYPDGTTKLCKNIAQEKGATYFDPQTFSFSLYTYYGPARGPWAKIIRRSILLQSCALQLPRRFTNREDAMMLTCAARVMRKAVLLADVVYSYRNQFGITAVSNKLSIDYWSDYLEYTEHEVLKGLLPKWHDVWAMTLKDIFSIIVHGGNIRYGAIPSYFKQNVLPELQSLRGDLSRAERLYVDVLGLPIILKLPVCTVLFLLWKVKKYLLGNYFSKKSRRY
ncbi:glycosyltransferase family 2 protein [Prevotella sp. P6B4]|uniref:glycosyltransferase family 2 protein n=1 Tax=Prevotella sp. P6B4 TaxID=1410614 RepID=UPI000684BF5F|nr:glycosyltransferase family 2 protein [Prevotella sp. P6B4]